MDERSLPSVWADTWVVCDAYLPTQGRAILRVLRTESLGMPLTPQVTGWSLILNGMVLGAGDFGR